MVWTSPAARPTGPARGVAAGGGAGCRTTEVRVVPAASSGMALRVTAPTTRCCCLERRSFPGGGKPFPFPGGGESFFPMPQQLLWRRCGPPRGDGAATLCRRCPRRRLALQSSVREISTRPPRAEGVNAAILCNGKQQPFLSSRCAGSGAASREPTGSPFPVAPELRSGESSSAARRAHSVAESLGPRCAVASPSSPAARASRVGPRFRPPSGSPSRYLLAFPRASGQKSQQSIHRPHRSSSTTPVKPSDGLPAPSPRTPLPCTVLTCYTWSWFAAQTTCHLSVSECRAR